MTVGQAAQGGTGKAMLAYSDNLVMTTTSALDGCDIYVNEGSLQVAPGRIWAKFSPAD